ncbi:MAG TPA: SufD family Fe-S cluster assembly protein, partial [Pyrinomonadaceae bacterium]|nr:SufD family Fe-S cluster assembly protein [Pyrinomonadaceae bacterium]
MTAATETIHAGAFRQFLQILNEADWTRQLREEAFSAFAEMGFPSVKNEDWKYTNVAPIANADWRIEPPSRINPVPEGPFGEIFRGFDFERNGFTAMNYAFAEPYIFRIPKDTNLETPIEFSFATRSGTAAFPHVMVFAEAGSKATIIETYHGGDRSFTNAAVQVLVEHDAHLTHYRVQKESAEAFHVGTTEVTLGRGSFYNATNINLGGAISRHDAFLKFSDEGAEAFVDGLYMLNGSQHADTHSVIDHKVPNCT